MDFSGACEDVFGEFSAFRQQPLLLFVAAFECLMDLLILHSEAIEALVAGQVNQHPLELPLQFIVGDILNPVLFFLSLHQTVTINNYMESSRNLVIY